MNLVYRLDEFIAGWVAERIPHVGADGFGPCSAIGVAKGEQIIAGMVYHDYQPAFGTIQLSMAAESPIWARREVIAGLLAYPFVQLGCFKVWTLTPIENERAIKVNIHCGFTKEATLAHQFGRKRHGVVCRLLQPDFQKRYGVS